MKLSELMSKHLKFLKRPSTQDDRPIEVRVEELVSDTLAKPPWSQEKCERCTAMAGEDVAAVYHRKGKCPLKVQ